MSNWSTKTLPHFNGHQRSASVVGYHDFLYSTNDQPKYDQSWSNQPQGTFYSSSMDISRTGQNSTDYKRFAWRSSHQNQPSKSVSTYHDPVEYSQRQRPFENAFKSAIIKMKESSLSRLGAVEKNIPNKNTMKTGHYSETEEYYDRNCQTLPLNKKPSASFDKGDSGRKIFKCDSFQNRNRSNVSQASKISSHTVSDTEADNVSRNNQQNSISNFFDNSNTKTSSSSSNFKYSSLERGVKPESSVIIPVKENKVSSVTVEQNTVKTEAYISPNFAKTNQSILPGDFLENKNSTDDNLNFEPLPSVQEIISKVEALNEQTGKSNMSKSLHLTHEKPPTSLSYRSGSQRVLDNIHNSSIQNDSSIQSQKRMSGLYKKNNSTPPKGKSLLNLPSDFQKLHMAFLDQKQENQRLRQELAEKNEMINQLEANLKTYEPWR